MKERLINNIGLKVTAVLFACALWLMVINDDKPVVTREFNNIEVIVQHEEVIKNAGKTYQVSEESKKVTVYVKGVRQILDKITAENIKAVADLRQLNLKTLVPIKVYITGFEGQYKEAYTNPQNLQLSIETSEVKTFPLNVTTVGTLQNGLVVGSLLPQPEKVKISGPEATIKKVDRVVAKVDVSGVTKDTSLPAELVYYDVDNNVLDQRMIATEPEELEVMVDVKIFHAKQVLLNFDISGVSAAEGYTYNISYEPESILVAGASDVLEKLEEIKIPKSALQLENINQKTEVVVDVAPYLPENVKLVDENANTVVVTASVEEIGSKVIEYPVPTISVYNLADGMKVAYQQQSVEFTFRGSEEALGSLTVEKISASVDLGAFKQEGEVEVPVQVVITQPDITIDNASIKIALKKK